MGYCFALVRGRSRSRDYLRLDESEMYISFNFSWYFHRVLKGGLESIYGMKAKDASPILHKAHDALTPIIEREQRTKRIASRTWEKGKHYNQDEANADMVWYTCALNAQRAIGRLLALGAKAPHFTWSPYADC